MTENKRMPLELGKECEEYLKIHPDSNEDTFRKRVRGIVGEFLDRERAMVKEAAP